MKQLIQISIFALLFVLYLYLSIFMSGTAVYLFLSFVLATFYVFYAGNKKVGPYLKMLVILFITFSVYKNISVLPTELHLWGIYGNKFGFNFFKTIYYGHFWQIVSVVVLISVLVFNKKNIKQN